MPVLLLGKFLENLIVLGTLTVIDPAGRQNTFGGKNPGRHVTIRLHRGWLATPIVLSPSLATGEAYMDGSLTVEDGTIHDFLDFIGRNLEARGRAQISTALMSRVSRIFRRIHQYNRISRARRNVAHHYDLSGALYDLFLDSDRQYSCGYFASPDDSLETAQFNKKRHIAAKLLPEAGQTVLDIGSGWGGMALYLAREVGCHVTGITLSEEQLNVSRNCVADAGLKDQVDFHLRDYREQTGSFDRIVSVGMFEHVGVSHFDQYFGQVRNLLAQDGVALLHTIGRTDGPGVTDPWIRKYIFPGGYIPALSEMIPVIERSGLVVTDIEVLRLHYAETLRHWRLRFLANRHKVAEIYDERFCRMWEFYLSVSEISFRYLNTVVFQIQMARREEAVPLTRDYITDADRAGNLCRTDDTRRSA